MADQSELQLIHEASRRITYLHSRKRAPHPGDWLAEHAERGQTFAQYLRARRTRPIDLYSRTYVRPIGAFTPTQRQIIDLTADLLSRVYGAPASVLPQLNAKAFPATARRAGPLGDEQVLTSYILEQVLLPERPRDALALIGLTALDLWPGPGWNFVFGEASITERVGVWSIRRYGDPDSSPDSYLVCLRRTLKVAVHETGHMLGILHCTAFECCMNGSNHLQEMDARPMAFCPECAAKVWWGCRIEPVAWFTSLAEFAQGNGLHADAEFWSRSADALRS